MHFQDLAFALFATGAFAAPAALVARDSCSDACYSAYNTCRSAPEANRASCASEYASCLGYSPYDSNGSLVTPTACSKSVTPTATPTATSIPGGCNPAHPGSCPSSYFSTTTAAPSVAPSATADACVSKCNDSYNQCRSAPGANRASCASDYASCLGYSPYDSNGSLVTPTACSSSSVASSTAPATTIPATTAAPTTAAPTTTVSPDQTSIVEGLTWTIKELIRYCSADGSGCEYNFALTSSDGRPEERCSISRMPGKDATTEDFYGVPCNAASANSISWGVSEQFGANNAFAVLTVTNNQSKTIAYFGVANVNSNEVTPSSPAGSGNFGDIGPQPVYTF
ncbi:hypothetical protein MFRU_032g01160 [Monilinia fructicola]|uniref:Uncharacterized protein n=1 Tax=Monilinia fructicola TaxID=38448 RepID=A0A5M9J4L3_MONFR|nr:hypothetical protein EYC84_012150 [Monilinia fructicola]KAG4027250.1 hypothetical protein MFRU_032g01160 [Monilinia fructicola]